MEEIPLIARICSICYAFETYTHPNNKTVSLSKADAIKEILNEAGKAYDPLIVEVFATMEDELVVEGETFKKFEDIKSEENKQEVEISIVKSIDKEKEIVEEIEELHKPIEMIYSPIVDIETDETMYYHSEMILFDEYIGELRSPVYGYVAEKTGQIVKLTELGLRNILYAIKTINKYNDSQIKLALRLYESHVKRPSFLSQITSVIENCKISYSQLVFEIPEQAFNNADDYVFESIKELKRRGAKIAILDFGIGLSSTSTLSEIDFDLVVIPRKLIKDVAISTRVGGMVRGFLELIKQLDAKAICEGVETIQEYETLKKYGYTLMQGPYFNEEHNEESLIRKLRGNF